MKTLLYLKTHLLSSLLAGLFLTLVAAVPVTGSSAPEAVNAQTMDANAPFSLRLNSGGNKVSYGNEVFEKDNHYNGYGKSYTNPSVKSISKTDRDALYLTERSTLQGRSTFDYAIAVPNGTYTVKLHFAEIYWGATGGRGGNPGDRVFDVSIENRKVLSNFDIYKEVGSMAALIKTYTVKVTDGKMNLDFKASKDQPKLAALEILQQNTSNNSNAVYINAGGGAVKVGSKTFAADTYYKGGRQYSNTKIRDIKNTTADALYKTERSTGVALGRFSYEIPLKAGKYEVKLHFAELWWGATGGLNPGENRRIFSVDLEGRNIIKNLDLVKEYGSMTAVIKTYTADVNDGTLNIDFSASKDEPKVSAIEVVKVSDDKLPLVARINTGGPAMVINGLDIEKDSYFSSGSKANKVNLPGIKNTSSDAAYMSERSADKDLGPFSYNFPLTNGQYQVRLHFAEIWFGIPGGGPAGTGKRIFDVAIENNKVIKDLDITKEVGGQTALKKIFTVNVADGELNIDFTATKDRPTIAAIEIYGNGQLGDPQADPCEWHYVAGSSIKKTEAQSAKVDEKLYTLAGFTTGLKILGTTEIYDPAKDVWTKGANIPLPVTHMGVTVVDRDIWVVGGFAGNHPGVATNRVQIYNTTSNTWRNGPSLPNRRASGAAVYNKGKIHFFGGLLPDRMTDVDEHYVLDLNNLGKGWKPAAKLPHGRNHLSGASVDGIVYAIGGQYGHDNREPEDQKFLDAYNPATDTWTSKADLPSARSHFEPGTMVHNGKIIIVGGRRGYLYFFNDITIYDPATDSWSEFCKLPNRNMAASAKVFGNRLLVANGGINGERYPTDETKWIYIEPETSNATASAKASLAPVQPLETEDAGLKLYPNPTPGDISLEVEGLNSRETVNLTVKNMSGMILMEREVMAADAENSYQLPTNSLRQGIYFVEITQGSTMKKVVRFVKM